MTGFTENASGHPAHNIPIYFHAPERFGSEINSPDWYKLVLLRSGSGLVTLNSTTSPVLAPGVWCLNETDRVVLKEHSAIEAESLYFHPTFINASLTFSRINQPEPANVITADQMDYDSLRPFHQKTRRGFYPLSPTTEQRVRKLCEAIRTQLEDQPDAYWPCRSRSYFLELLFLLLQLYLDAPGREESELPVSQDDSHPVILYLLNHYHQKITLDQLAKEFGTNRNSLNLEFKTQTDCSVIEYLLRLRVRIACQLLKDTSLPITEVAERVGYVDVTHFGRIFRRRMQLSPSAYRKRHKTA